MIFPINYCFLFLLVTPFLFFMTGTASDSLCDNPVISSADRMTNGTVRLYRDNQYWELKGLPDKIGVLSGPFKVWYSNFGSVYRNTSIMSCLVCNRKGYVFKFEGNKWWSWQTSGEQWKGDKNGEVFKDFPSSDNGFDAVFHNGKQDDPLMVGLIGNKVFYYSTKPYFITLAPDYDKNGYIGGKFEEKFPTGIEAAFSWPPNTPEEGYYVYLFKGNKYCIRKEKAKNGKECDEWRLNKQLFGCNMSGVHNEEKVEQEPNSGNKDKEDEVTVVAKDRQQSDDELKGPDLEIDPDLRETKKPKSNIPDTAYESNSSPQLPSLQNSSMPSESSEIITAHNSTEIIVTSESTQPEGETHQNEDPKTEIPTKSDSEIVDPFNTFMITITIAKSDSTLIQMRSVQNNLYSMSRLLSSNTQSCKYDLPPLMEFHYKNSGPPSLTLLKAEFYFKPCIDKCFDTNSFLEVAKEALYVISTHLANNNIEGIKSLVTEEAFGEISKNYKTYTAEQKLKLRVNFDDILHCIPLNIQIDRISEFESNVKIVVFFDILNNASDTQTQNKWRLIGKDFRFFDFKHKAKLMEPLFDQKFFCIYEFSRQYSNDKTGPLTDWIVTKLVHYKNKDIWKRDGFID